MADITLGFKGSYHTVRGPDMCWQRAGMSVSSYVGCSAGNIE